MRVTVVPNRNLVLLSLAAAWAAARDVRTVAYAAHAGDHTIYPDCRPEFVEAARQAIRFGCEVEVVAPYVHWTKAQIVARGAQVGAPLGLTWSCYEGGERHCGRCGTCVERREAFPWAGVEDPTEYAL